MSSADRSPAARCRRNGWGVGTILERDVGFGTLRIEITAIGHRRILAHVLSQTGTMYTVGVETCWLICPGQWRRVA